MPTRRSLRDRIRGWFLWVKCHNKAVCIATVTVAVVGTVLVLSGCSPVKPVGQGLRIVSTTTPVTDFTKQIVGKYAHVDGLIQANQSAHEFDPSARALVELAQADVLVINGLGLEPWLEGAIDASGFDGTIITASAGINVVEGDPHVWTSPTNAIAMVKTITSGLGPLDETAGVFFRKNSRAYVKKLTLLNTWATQDINQVPTDQRMLVTNHDGLSYFCAQYGITFVGSIIPSFDDNSEPSAADIDKLVAAIKRTGTKAVFSETTISPKLAQTIAEEAGVKVYSGADSLYADTLGPAGSPGDTYINATIHNVRVLVRAWGATNLPLPKGLEQ